MDRDTTLKLAPIFRGLSMLLIVLTFCSWALPYFSYDADTFGIDNSKGPLRFVPQEVPAYAEVSAATYTDYVTQNLLNKDTGAYRVTLRFTPTEEFGVYDADSAMSYSDYLTQNVYDKDTGEFKVSLKIAAADVPNGASDDGTAYVSYINQYVIPAVASNSDSKFLNFFAEDIPAYDSASGSEQDYINQNLYDPATGEFRIPLRFIPKDIPLFQAEIGMTYQEYAYQYIIDSETGDYKTPVKVVSSLYRGNDTLKTLDGKNEVHDFPDKYSLWEFVLMAYNFPQILAQINYKSSLPEGQKYHDRFYDANNNERPWRTIKIANMDHEDINTNPRFIKMWFLAPTLYQIILGVVGLLMCWKKRGIMTQFFPLLFGAIGIVGYFTNRILLYNNYPATYWVHIVMCILVLANAIIGFVIQALEIKSRPDEYYLPMV